MRTSLVIVAAVAAVAVALAVLAVAAIPTALGGATRGGALNPIWQAGGGERPIWCNATPRARVKWMRGFTGRGLVEVSSEYTNAVINILRSDPDTAKLLQEGYNVTWIRPIITAVVTGTGDVTLRATRALVLLNGTNATAQVLVDVSQGKVLEIAIVTRTVITKS